MATYGFMNEEPIKEMLLGLEKLKNALFDGLDDARSAHEKNELMRKAWGYAEAVEAQVKIAKKIIV